MLGQTPQLLCPGGEVAHGLFTGSPLRRTKEPMRLLLAPGVHRPVTDTWMLRDAMLREGLRGRTVADLGAGSGVLALAAAGAGARRVCAVDVSRRSNIVTLINARLNGCAVDVRHGDLIRALRGEQFDIIVSNPPYVPAETDELPRHRSTTALDGGRDGRLLLDRVCREAPPHLRPGGSLLIVHSSVCGIQQTCELLGERGLQVQVVERANGTLGPVLRARTRLLRARGLLGEADQEELVVIRARRGAQPAL